jgi:hypothetical protein
MDFEPKQEMTHQTPVEKPNEFPGDLWDKLVNFSEPMMGARKGFEHHTWTAVYWANQIGNAAIKEGITEAEKNPVMSLTILAFLHDLGYSGVTAKIYNEDGSMVTDEAKIEHQKVSAELAEQFFSSNHDIVSKYLNENKQKELIELIKIHDNHESLLAKYTPENRLLKLFNEVDSISTIDMRFGKPSFPKEKLIEWWKSRPMGYTKDEGGEYSKNFKGRYNLFITSRGKEAYRELSKKLIDYANS